MSSPTRSEHVERESVKDVEPTTYRDIEISHSVPLQFALEK